MKKTHLLFFICFTILFYSCKKGGSTISSCNNIFVMQGDSIYHMGLPTAFIPNSIGYDSVYRFQYEHDNPYVPFHDSFSIFQLSVYKLSGTLVFHTTNPNTVWDGRDLSGKMCTDYEYTARIKLATIGGRSADTCSYIYMPMMDTTKSCVKVVKADYPKYRWATSFDLYTGGFPYDSWYQKLCP